jgi:molybdopterin converting factor subunit 1
MKISILAFGIAKDIFGDSSIEIELNGADVKSLKALLEERYGRLKDLKSYMVAVNNEYATDDKVLSEKDEIAIIPPVSGG